MLQKITLKSISHKQCSEIYNHSDVDIGHICTLTREGEGACNVSFLFDSGFSVKLPFSTGRQRRSAHVRRPAGRGRQLGRPVRQRKTRCVCASFLLPRLASHHNEHRMKLFISLVLRYLRIRGLSAAETSIYKMSMKSFFQIKILYYYQVFLFEHLITTLQTVSPSAQAAVVRPTRLGSH